VDADGDLSEMGFQDIDPFGCSLGFLSSLQCHDLCRGYGILQRSNLGF
jgi:hypothetical protein